MSTGLQLFFLGAVHFYSIFFIAKYFEYIYLTFQGLLVLFAIQILSFFTNLWQPQISKHRYYLFALYVFCIYSLSLAKLETNVGFIIAACVGLFVFIQSEILRKLKDFKPGIQQGYGFELLGGLCGVFLYYTLTAKIGFQGFYAVATIIMGAVLLSELPKKMMAIGIVPLLALCFVVTEPQPLVNKRQRFDMLSQEGSLLAHAWDPNGHVELIKTNYLPNNYILSFEGGALRSHIFEFDGNYERLKTDYLSGLSTGTWGLDVILPHFLKPQAEKVALISSVGGQEILAAKAFGAKSIDVIDINGSAQKMVADLTKNFNGDIYSSPVQVFTEDGRHFIQRSKNIYDIIQIYSAESASLSSALGSFFRPSSLITKESLQDYEQHLKDDGILQITIDQYLKVKATFESAFGDQVFFRGAKMLVMTPEGREHRLVTFLYKKNGWSEGEINSVSSWLLKDNRRKWMFLTNPLDSDEAKQLSLSRLSTPETFLRPSTDNWPFLRVATAPQKTLPIHYLFYALIAVTALFFFPLRKRSFSSFDKYGSFVMGSTYSFAQSIFIIQFQKISGQPGLGLCLAVGWCLILTGLAAVTPRKKISRLIFMILALALLPLFSLGSEAGLFLLSILMFAQGVFFVLILKKNHDRLNYIFWFNGLGFSLGIVLFNLAFILFGFWQALTLITAMYLLVALICKKSEIQLEKR